VVVFGDGNQTRDFVYVDDVVEALISAAQAPNIDQQIINVGSGEETSLNTLIDRIAMTLGEKANVLYNGEMTGGIARMVADVSKAQVLLNYVPSVRLVDGLRKLVELDPRFHHASHKPIERMREMGR
jgi:nucleoside-diphosphate-sugar epimerase